VHEPQIERLTKCSSRKGGEEYGSDGHQKLLDFTADEMLHLLTDAGINETSLFHV
jgi:hypothetical protein